MSDFTQEKIGVIGLGYVGLPLAAALADVFEVVGFDVQVPRTEELKRGEDHTGEVEPAALRKDRLSFTSDITDLSECTFLVVAVPTPITKSHEPDLSYLEKASEMAGSILRPGMMVSYESTVYPGVTEEVCLPILEKQSGLRLGQFDLGYSPERVNPGDKEHTITKIMKVVSGHDEAACARAQRVYGAVITAGIHSAASIKTAEAAKVIENVQRDLNIALMNELSKIFSKMDIRTQDVLEAAGTKWNFHRYHPGLVGGHCIGVDPYYLTHRAFSLGYHPEVILAGRRINDDMGFYVGNRTVRMMNSEGRLPRQARVLVMGFTFKENVPDLRNTRAIDVVKCLRDYECEVMVCEPLADKAELKKRYGIESVSLDEATELDAVILVNGHDEFRALSLESLKQRMRTPVLMDVKNFYDPAEADRLGFRYGCL